VWIGCDTVKTEDAHCQASVRHPNGTIWVIMDP